MGLLDITHPFVSDGDPLIGGSEWNAAHDTGSPVIRIPQLVEEKTVPALATNSLFSGLDGDANPLYLFDFELTVVATGEPILYFLPNDLATNLRSTVNRWWSNTGDSVTYTDKMSIIRHGAAGQTLYYSGWFLLRGKTGKYRLWKGTWETDGPSQFLHGNSGGAWRESATNLTSLKFYITNATMSGTIKLYKLFDTAL